MNADQIIDHLTRNPAARLWRSWQRDYAAIYVPGSRDGDAPVRVKSADAAIRGLHIDPATYCANDGKGYMARNPHARA